MTAKASSPLTNPMAANVDIMTTWKRRGGHKVIIAPDGDTWAPAKPRPDEPLIRALARAHRWERLLEEGRCRSAAEIAEAEKIHRSFGGWLLPLTLLAPDIQEAILDARQAKGMQLEELTRAMLGKWGGQRVRGENSNRALADFTDHLRQRCKRCTSFGLNRPSMQSTQLPEIPTAKGDTIMSYATMHDIYHLLEADRPDEARRPIPAPVAKRDKSDERRASGHEPKAQLGTDLAA